MCNDWPLAASIRGLRTKLVEEQLTRQTRQQKILVSLNHFVHCRPTYRLHLYNINTLYSCFSTAYIACFTV